MKKTVIGLAFVFIGLAWFIFVAGPIGLNESLPWQTKMGPYLGRLYMVKLAMPTYILVGLAVLGILILFIEYFRD